MAAPTHEQKRDLFESHFLLGKLEPGEIDTLATRALVESYRAGQEIFAKGSPGRTMFAVLQGSVKIVSLSPTERKSSPSFMPARSSAKSLSSTAKSAAPARQR